MLYTHPSGGTAYFPPYEGTEHFWGNERYVRKPSMRFTGNQKRKGSRFGEDSEERTVSCELNLISKAENVKYPFPPRSEDRSI